MPRLPEDPDRTSLSPEDVATLMEGAPEETGPNVPGTAGSSAGLRPQAVDAAESRRRRETMNRLLANGASDDIAMETFMRVLPFDDGSPGFNMSEYAIRDLMRLCRNRWVDEDRERGRHAKSASIRRHLRHIERAAKKGAWGPVAMLEKNLAAIEGTLVHRIEITTDNALSDALMNVLGEIAPEEARRLIDEEARIVTDPRQLSAANVATYVPSKTDPFKAARAKSALDAMGRAASGKQSSRKRRSA